MKKLLTCIAMGFATTSYAVPLCGCVMYKFLLMEQR